MLISKIMEDYRVASRDTFNHFFRPDEFLADRFLHVDSALLQTMVLDRLHDQASDDRGAYGALQFTAAGPDVVAFLQEEDGRAVGLQAVDRVAFIAFVDGSGSYRDAEFVRGRVVEGGDRLPAGSEVLARWSDIRFVGSVAD